MEIRVEETSHSLTLVYIQALDQNAVRIYGLDYAKGVRHIQPTRLDRLRENHFDSCLFTTTPLTRKD